MNKKAMIEEILIVCKANDVPTTGELFFGLAFLSDAALRSICRELHIRV